MSASGRKSFSRNAGSWVFVGIVVLGYGVTLWYRGVDVSAARGLLCLAFGLAYAVTGYFCSVCDEESLPGWRGPLLVLLMVGLLAGILYTSRMAEQIFLCAFPVAAVSLKLLRPFAIIVTEVVIVGIVVAALKEFTNPDWVMRNTLSFLSAFVFVLVFTSIALRAGKERRKAERLSLALEEANRQLQAQSGRMAELARVMERNRLARDIHDGLGHYLTTIHVQLEAAQALHPGDTGRAMEAVAKAHGLAREALLEVRKSVEWLKADEPQRALVDRLGDLAKAVDESAAGAPLRESSLSVRLEVLGEGRPLDSEAEQGLYRAAQEGLTNVRKHAAARHATVVIDYREPELVSVRVLDDGRGAASPGEGHGLTGLGDRLALLGGSIRAQNQSTGGFCLEAEVPARNAPKADPA
jgi:signal transduction histidine kinase